MDNDVFRAVKAHTPGPYTFILKATREAPKVMLHPKKKTVGVRVPQHATALALLAEIGPLMSSSLILPGHDDPMFEGWEVLEELGGSLGTKQAGDWIANYVAKKGAKART